MNNAINFDAVRQNLEQFAFTTLFCEELGWDRHQAEQEARRQALAAERIKARVVTAIQQALEVESLEGSWGSDWADNISATVWTRADSWKYPAQRANLLHTEQRDILFQAVSSLPKRYAWIMCARCGFNTPERSLRKIGRRLGFSAERIRQMEKKALERLREWLKQNYPDIIPEWG